MAKGSWSILKEDKKLILFPILSGVCCLLLVAPLVLRLSEGGDDEFRPSNDADPDFLILGVEIFLIYFGLHFVVTFFNSAIIAYASQRIRGEDATLKEALLAAVDCIMSIAGVGNDCGDGRDDMGFIEEGLGRFGRIVVDILGLTWTALTFLVIPIMVIERRNAIMATQESAELLKEVWGEGLLSTFYFFRVFLYLCVPGVILFALGFMIATNASMIIGLCLSGIYFVVLTIAHASLKSIFQAVLYYYARENMVADGFRRDDLRRAFSK